MRKSLVGNLYFISFIIISSTFFSCDTTRKIKYFQDIPDSGRAVIIPKANYTPPIIKVDDIITVIVETIDPTSTAAINLGNIPEASTGTQLGGNLASALSGTGQEVSAGYLVDKDGFINIPILGKIYVENYTTTQATDSITKVALKYYKQATVIVRFANFKVSVTGEVLRPGIYVMPNEKVSIMDAIADAGDLTIFGKRENVLLLRENEDGTKTAYRVNLKKKDIMSAPYFYLRQNDLIYVEPRRAKSDANDASQTKYITIAGALLSILVIYATRKS